MADFNDMLINQDTGEIDLCFIKRSAVARAAKQYGAPEAPCSWVRDEIRNLQDRAAVIRRQWRDARKLPDDTEMTTVTAFGKHVEGVRRSAF